MNSKRLIYLALSVVTLSIGVLIGSIVSGGVKATGEQKPSVLVIPDPVAMSNSFSQIASQLEPAVVNINVEIAVPTPTLPQRGQGGGGRNGGRNGGRGGNAPQIDPDNPLGSILGGILGGNAPNVETEPAEATGTGFIVDKAGYIITNEHVVKDATKITVLLSDKTKFDARLIGTDSKTDLAVIKIDADKDLTVAKFGNSDAVKTGDWVLAVGSPFGFDHTVTSGIISAKGRSASDLSGGNGPPTDNDGFQSFLQTDAAINPGNSGGPLVSMAGEVIGINTAIVSSTDQFAGLGFALPSNIAIKVYNQLAQNGKVTRGKIGITYSPDLQNLETLHALGLKEGVVVEDIVIPGPAALAGIKYGDVITAIDGQKITSGPMLLDIVASSPVDHAVQIRILRDGKERVLPVMIVDRDAEKNASKSPTVAVPVPAAPADRVLGIAVQVVPQSIVKKYALAGVAISSIQKGSVAADVLAAMTEPGSNPLVIDSVIADGHETQIRTTADYDRAIASLKRGMKIAFGMFIAGMPPGSRVIEYQHSYIPMTMP